jgi:hypothetical protein
MQRRKVSTGSKDGSMQSGSKHQWIILVDAPTWKVENGFKSGYLLELEMMMLEKIPGCKLRAQPHIENKWGR